MVANDSYETKVYAEQGGDRYVANSGGVFAIESGGSLAIYSGAQMTIESGINFEIATGDLAGTDARKALISNQLMDSQLGVLAATKLAVSNVPHNIGVYVVWASDAAVDYSIWLQTVSAGRELVLVLAGDSTGAFTNTKTTLTVSCSGCKILGSLGGYMSHILMNASAASDCLVHFMSPYDDFWAIVNERGDVDEKSDA